MKKNSNLKFYNPIFLHAFSYEPQAIVRGSRNDDSINGTEFADKIRGRHGNDTIFGDDGNDVLYGNRGNDFIDGGDGNDVLIGGKGVDEITGGDGADVFYFKKRDSGKKINGDDLDVVTDYNYDDGDVIQTRFKFDTVTLENGVMTFSRKSKEVNSIIFSTSPQTVNVNGIDVVDSGGDPSIAVSTSPLIDSNLTAENFYRGSISGIELTSNTAGDIKLGDALINAQAIDGEVTLGGSDGVLATAAQGVFSVTNGSALGTDTSAIIYALGTDGSDTLSGQYVWGYGGFDTITGTDRGDWLIGGDGGASITGGKGADYMFGGSGIDTFIISASNGDTGNSPGGPGENPTSDSVFNFATGSDKLDLDIAGTSQNFKYLDGTSGISNANEGLNAAIQSLDGNTFYVCVYNMTYSGNSWLYYFADGTSSNHQIIELVGLGTQQMFVYGDIV
jgi:Ca2+-binding RTX toxin-like protein